MKKVDIEPIRQEDFLPASVILSRAFSIELNNLAVFRGERNIERRQQPLFSYMLKKFPGTILVAKQESNIIGVACMVKWPQCQMTQLAMLQYILGMFPVLRGGLLREFRLRRVWAKYDPNEMHWHIGPIGIAPELQRRGFGSELIASSLEIVDGEHEPAYLETDRMDNVRFYQHFGFSIVAEQKINGVRNWFMWRVAR